MINTFLNMMTKLKQANKYSDHACILLKKIDNGLWPHWPRRWAYWEEGSTMKLTSDNMHTLHNMATGQIIDHHVLTIHDYLVCITALSSKCWRSKMTASQSGWDSRSNRLLQAIWWSDHVAGLVKCQKVWQPGLTTCIKVLRIWIWLPIE